MYGKRTFRFSIDNLVLRDFYEDSVVDTHDIFQRGCSLIEYFFDKNNEDAVKEIVAFGQLSESEKHIYVDALERQYVSMKKSKCKEVNWTT